MKFGLFDHAGKGLYLRQKLLEAGHQHADTPEECELLVLDCDWPWAAPRPMLIERAKNAGAKIVTYPHGGRPTVFVYDGLAEPDERVDARLEHGPGSIQLAETFTDQDLHQQAFGWLYSPTHPFRPPETLKKVLFAPLHCNVEALLKGTNGHDPAPVANQEIYRRLLAVPNIEITVSIVGPPWRNGLWQHPRARFAPNPQMLFQHSFEQILSADAVVASGTMLAAAVALGKPTVGFCQDIFVDYIDGHYVEANNADRYRSLVRYPLDAEGDSLQRLLDHAVAAEQTRWRNLWVGSDGTDAAVAFLQDLVRHQEPVRQSGDMRVAGATAVARLGS